MIKKISYSEAILEAKNFLLKNYKNFIILGQGVTSPWYVGSTMTNLNQKFPSRVLETPVSENASTSIAFGASLSGLKALIVHPRMDFMLYGVDAIVNQAAKWSGMFGKKITSPVTIRAIINRGNEQGAQHSQSLQSWFVHIPGINVVTPYSPLDARDLLIASVLSNKPTLFIDDRWLYENTESYKKIRIKKLNKEKLKFISKGKDLTIVSYGYGSHIAKKTSDLLYQEYKLTSDVIDLRVLSNIDYTLIQKSALKSKNLIVIDFAWGKCGMSSEILSNISILNNDNKINFKKITFPFVTTPTASNLEQIFYPSIEKVKNDIINFYRKNSA